MKQIKDQNNEMTSRFHYLEDHADTNVGDKLNSRVGSTITEKGKPNLLNQIEEIFFLFDVRIKSSVFK